MVVNTYLSDNNVNNFNTLHKKPRNKTIIVRKNLYVRLKLNWIFKELQIIKKFHFTLRKTGINVNVYDRKWACEVAIPFIGNAVSRWVANYKFLQWNHSLRRIKQTSTVELFVTVSGRSLRVRIEGKYRNYHQFSCLGRFSFSARRDRVILNLSNLGTSSLSDLSNL